MERTWKQAVKDQLMLVLVAPLVGLLRLALPIIAGCIYVKRLVFKLKPKRKERRPRDHTILTRCESEGVGESQQ